MVEICTDAGGGGSVANAGGKGRGGRDASPLKNNFNAYFGLK